MNDGPGVPELLDLADWRRRVAVIWEAWRQGSSSDPAMATTTFRAAKDALVRDHPQSPLSASQRVGFSGLSYWPYDPAWRLRGRLIPSAPDAASSSASMSVPTVEVAVPWSATSVAGLRPIGHVSLGSALASDRLPAFWVEGYTGGLFVAFLDGTSGSETYAGGRFLLDTAKSADHGLDPRTGELILDFNLAFHPSCAYDSRWTCPLAAQGARLGVPVRVGERLQRAA